jgi:MoaA/NifB/PqqE/SkfB family radical SAM enzyme
MNSMGINETATSKSFRSDDYNYYFNKQSGLTLTWGKTLKDDPIFSPFGPTIADIEISINGCPNKCEFCYKSNTNEAPTNMSFDTFKVILDKIKSLLTQVAFGITGVQTNPDFIRMMEYCRECGVVPNFTLSGIDLTDEIAERCAGLVGAVAVSAYKTDKNVCYNTVKKFLDLGVKQTNIHLMVSRQTIDFVYEVLNDRLNDTRLANMNAIVFLCVKPKGRAKDCFDPIDPDEYAKLIGFCLKNKIQCGFDSCSAPRFEYAISKTDLNDGEKESMISMSESCESFGISSCYIDVFGKYFPCSFAAGEGEWAEGIDVLNCKDFLKDVWFSEKLSKYRNISINTCYPSGCRKCLLFENINI